MPAAAKYHSASASFEWHGAHRGRCEWLDARSAPHISTTLRAVCRARRAHNAPAGFVPMASAATRRASTNAAACNLTGSSVPARPERAARRVPTKATRAPSTSAMDRASCASIRAGNAGVRVAAGVDLCDLAETCIGSSTELSRRMAKRRAAPHAMTATRAPRRMYARYGAGLGCSTAPRFAPVVTGDLARRDHTRVDDPRRSNVEHGWAFGSARRNELRRRRRLPSRYLRRGRRLRRMHPSALQQRRSRRQRDRRRLRRQLPRVSERRGMRSDTDCATGLVCGKTTARALGERASLAFVGLRHARAAATSAIAAAPTALVAAIAPVSILAIPTDRRTPMLPAGRECEPRLGPVFDASFPDVCDDPRCPSNDPNLCGQQNRSVRHHRAFARPIALRRLAPTPEMAAADCVQASAPAARPAASTTLNCPPGHFLSSDGATGSEPAARATALSAF